MRLTFLFLLVAYNLYSVKGQFREFIGQGSNSLYFAIKSSPGGWDWGLNYCHTYRLMPGSIETEEDHQLITNFLNTSASIDDDNCNLWLAATDHRIEGTFQWMWNMEEVAVGSWAPGMLSRNRSANCLAINRHGYFMEVSCFGEVFDFSQNFYTLCEAQNFIFRNQDFYSSAKVNHFDSNAMINNQLASAYQIPQTFFAIGQVGNIVYFADDQEKSWTESLDLCHLFGMRLASPEQPEQLEFIQEYVRQQDMIYYLGGSDRLSVSCLRSNSEFRWFYSGNPIVNQTSLTGGSWWYMCTFITPGGNIYPTGCANGGGAFAFTICELFLPN